MPCLKEGRRENTRQETGTHTITETVTQGATDTREPNKLKQSKARKQILVSISKWSDQVRWWTDLRICAFVSAKASSPSW